MSRILAFVVFVSFAAAAREASALPADESLRLPKIFGSGMVLQRDQEVPVWGWAAPASRVSVRFGEAAVEGVADRDGKWSVRLPPMAANATPQIMAIESGERIELRDILVGEVWLCSGQSNMQWSLAPGFVGSGVRDGAAEAAAANYPLIRFFNVKCELAARPRDDCNGEWKACSPETIGPFSAVGYFFGRELHRELGVPIGLIGSSWGGTPAEAWTSTETIRKFPEFDRAREDVERFGDDPAAARAAHESAMAEWLTQVDRLDVGTAQNWAAAAWEDANWKSVAVPGPLVVDGLDAFDGVVWLRGRFMLASEWTGRAAQLSLGPIDDMDRTFVNGVRIGATERAGSSQSKRTYVVPAGLLREGQNTVAIRVIDVFGLAGLLGKPEAIKLSLSEEGAGPSPIGLAGEWRCQRSVALSALPPAPPLHELAPSKPSAIYNAMIRPLMPYGIRGAIWYQGESNRTHAAQYRELFPALIADWRAGWRQGDFPFYFVQIAPYAYVDDRGEAALLREAQMLTMRRASNVGMAVTMDIGDPRDIHPANKQEVGRRLALWALAKTYGKPGIAFSGPLYSSMRIEGDAIRIAFDYAEGGLATRDKKLPTHFTIAGSDRKFVTATAKIEGETIVVRADGVANPVSLRYGWGAADEPNLCNRTGLPASSFRTDDW
ncbi:MAG: sialate O-acetylesterase [Phycisphaerae bacterium]|nr:sialate O-acetylesterase [Phycisphaerae bacterium]